MNTQIERANALSKTIYEKLSTVRPLLRREYILMEKTAAWVYDGKDYPTTLHIAVPDIVHRDIMKGLHYTDQAIAFKPSIIANGINIVPMTHCINILMVGQSKIVHYKNLVLKIPVERYDQITNKGLEK